MLLIFARKDCGACYMHKLALERVRRRFPQVEVVLWENAPEKRLDEWKIESFPTTILMDKTLGEEGQELRRWNVSMDETEMNSVFQIASRFRDFSEVDEDEENG